MVNAQIVDGSGAVDAGFLDETTTPDNVVSRAIEVAQGFAEQLDPKAYASTVRAMRSDLLTEMDQAVAADRAAAGL